MSIIEQQKELEYYPDDVLAQEMMQPTGIAPSFLVATEIKRRNDMRNAYQSKMNPQPQTSVVEEEVMDLGGIPNVDPNAVQQQMMAQQGGMPQQQMMQQPMPQNAPMQMQEGGTVEYGVDEGAITDDGSGFLSAGLGAVGLLRRGGNIRYQMGAGISPNVYAGQNVEDITDDEAGFLTNFWQSMSPAEKVTLAGSATLAATPIPGGRIMALMRGIPTIMKSYRAYKPLRTGLGKITRPLYKTQPRTQGRFSKDWEIGGEITNYLNPARTEFLTRTAPVAGIAGVIGSNVDMGAPIIEDVNAAGVPVDPKFEGMSSDEIAAIKSEDNILKELADKLSAEKTAVEDAERDRRADLTESGRMLEDAMENVPENTTFQDYLSTLEGMEETRKGQVLMDLGASIANASHGGDIAKGFQEAGTRARAEKIEASKEKARVLGESRAMDIDVAIKMATIQAEIEYLSKGKTLNELLALLQMNEDFLTDNYTAETAKGIMDQIERAITLTLPPVPEKEESPE